MRLSDKERKMLHVYASKAFRVAGGGRTAEEFRHAVVREVCGRSGFSDMAPADVPAVRDAFKRMAGEPVKLSDWELAKREQHKAALKGLMARYGFAPAYLAKYLATRFQRDFSGSQTVEQLCTGFYASVLKQLCWTIERAGRRKDAKPTA